MANLYAVILVIHLICAVALILLILVQPSEAGGFMGTGSQSNLMAPRRTADVMTRMTTIMAGCFFTTSLFLAISANHHQVIKSILDVDAGTPPAKQSVLQKDAGQKDVGQKDTGGSKDAAQKDATAPATDQKTVDQKASDKTDEAGGDEDSGDQKSSDKKPAGKNDGKSGAPKAPQTE